MEIKWGFMPSFCEYHFHVWCLVDHLPGFFCSHKVHLRHLKEFLFKQTYLKSGLKVFNLIALNFSVQLLV